MSQYFGMISGTKYDDLLGGDEIKVVQINVKLAENVGIKRGEVLVRGNDGYYSPVTGSDSHKMMVIAKREVGSEENRVTTAYSTGLFNREKIVTGSDVDIDELEYQLKDQGIYLTSINEQAEWCEKSTETEVGSETGTETGSETGSESE